MENVSNKQKTLINGAGGMTVAPGGKLTICKLYRIAIRIRLCDAPRRGIPTRSGATSPSDAHEDKREATFCVGLSSGYGGAGRVAGGDS